MDAVAQQVGERAIDQPLAFDPRNAREGGAFDDHGEVRFAGAVVAHMAAVLAAVVDHFEMRRRERLGEAGGDQIGGGDAGRVGHRAYIGRLFERGSVATGQPRKDRPNSRFHGRVEAKGRVCAEPGCEEPGEFRAPLAHGHVQGDGPPQFRWLCLDHVRAFNAGYNFFKGMSTEEIHDAQRPFAGWERETRAFSSNGGADRPPRWADFADPLDAIGARFRNAMPAERKDGRPLSGKDREALRVLALDVDADRMALRRRYSELVRKYHPDRNGGDRSHEAALQKTIEAYQHLKGQPAFG